jgi:hypothetical protein
MAAAGAQIVIHGKIVDDSTGLPVINSSIYLNRTTFGTTSNSNGEFTLEATGIYSGELIVSANGYECFSYILDIAKASKVLYKFKLIKKETQKNIIVQPVDVRKKWLANFKHTILGITAEADGCTIENLESVYFVKDIDQDITNAFADTPLIITNKLLGYEITYNLIEYVDDLNSGSVFSGYSRYREIGDKKKWAKRRKQNYYGSTMHFYRSLINKDLYKQGFSMFETKKPDGLINLVQNFNLAFINPDSIAPIAPIKILFIDDISNDYYLQFNNIIMVQYNKTPLSVDYLSMKGPVMGLNDKGFTACINLMADKVGIGSNGEISDPAYISYSGFWVYERLANQLPFDYEPN